MKFRLITKLCTISALFLAFTPIQAEETSEIQILFTSDLNAHVASTTRKVEEEDVTIGGYRNLAGTIASLDDENTLVLDAGNYATGTLYSYGNSSFSLLRAMGYDVVALGEHEFLQGKESVLSSLETIEGMSVIQSNVVDADFKDVLQQYAIQEVDGKKIGVFALMDSLSASNVKEISFLDALNRGQEVVDTLKAEGVDYIICLSRGGIKEEETLSFDQILANKVDGIDLIVSGNNTAMLEEPIKEKDTWIVSGGKDGLELGVLHINPDQNQVISYENMLVTEQTSTLDTGKVLEKGRAWLKDKGVSLSTVVGRADGSLQEKTQEFLADAMGNVYERMPEHTRQTAIGILPAQYAGAPIGSGNVTYESVLNAYGAGSQNETPVIPLYQVYVKGEDLRKLCEIDHTLGALHPMYQMTFGNLHYTYLDQRMVYDTIVDIYTVEAQGYWGKISTDTYYPIVTTSAFADLLKQASLYTEGALEVRLYNADGSQDVTDTFMETTATLNNGAELTLPEVVKQQFLKYNRASDRVYSLTNFTTESNQKVEAEMNVKNYFIHSSRRTLEWYARGVGIVFGALLALRILLKIWDAIHPNAARFDD